MNYRSVIISDTPILKHAQLAILDWLEGKFTILEHHWIESGSVYQLNILISLGNRHVRVFLGEMARVADYQGYTYTYLDYNDPKFFGLLDGAIKNEDRYYIAATL